MIRPDVFQINSVWWQKCVSSTVILEIRAVLKLKYLVLQLLRWTKFTNLLDGAKTR